VGYVPTFIGTLDDYNATGGTKFMLTGMPTWADMVATSRTIRSPTQVNRGMRKTIWRTRSGTPSPTSFDAGGVKFSHWVLNGDISQLEQGRQRLRRTELRHENYETIAGDVGSTYGSGADSYAGNSVQNSFPSSRSNYGAYAGATWM
jgi:iron complex outermembrane receptor protein